MIYRNFDELWSAMVEIMDRNNCADLSLFFERMHNDAEFLRLNELLRVYHDAERNPPELVIGVGAISYAEFVLQMVQK